jgi:electron transfer flavoprotein beta subunit
VLQVELVGNGIKVKRELEDGWMQQVEMPLPALLTIQSGGNRLRYATLMGIKKARQKEMREAPAAAATKRVVEVLKVSPPTRVKQTEMLTGSADEIAAKLVEKLRFEVKVL